MYDMEENQQSLLEYLFVRAREYLPKIDDGHGEDHIHRVLINALSLAQQLGGDKLAISIAAVLHDIHRWLNISPAQSLNVVETIIAPLSLTEEQRTKVLNAIRDHELYIRNGGFPVETQIIQDADRLDALGAIGIVRTFQYGFAHGIPPYTAKVELKQVENYTYETRDVSTIHHLYNKLVRLDDFMNTSLAKEDAECRIKMMKVFLDSFLREWKEPQDVF